AASMTRRRSSSSSPSQTEPGPNVASATASALSGARSCCTFSSLTARRISLSLTRSRSIPACDALGRMSRALERRDRDEILLAGLGLASGVSASVRPRSAVCGRRRRELTVHAWTEERRSHRREETSRAAERVVHRGRLVARVDHAVAAAIVSAVAVPIPVRRLEKLLERLRVSVLEEIAGPLPTEHVVGRHPPRRAFVVASARKELEKERRLIEAPLATRPIEDSREEVTRAIAAKETLLIGRLVVAVARGDHHALDADLAHAVEERAHALRVRAFEERRVRRDAEASSDRLTDRLLRDVVDAFAADGEIVLLV